MGVKVVDFKGDGNAWIVVHDQRLPGGRLRKYVGRDWKSADLAASHIRIKLAANDLSFVNGDRPKAVPLTLRQAVETYLRERAAFGTMDESTRRNYERLLARHVYPTLGSKPVTSIARDDLVRVFGRLLVGSAEPGGRKRGKATCRNLLAPIRQAYEWLIVERRMADLTNPALRLGKLLRETVDKKKRVQPLLPTEHAALLAATRRSAPRYHLLFLIALRTGLRLSECFGVQWDDFDLEARTVTVQRQFREGRLVDRTKKNKVRVVDLSREVCEELRAHRARTQREALAAGRQFSPFVFTTKLGGPIRSKSSFERRVFHRVLRVAGITRRVTFQNLRQTFCSDIVASTGDLLYASEQAGHSSVKITGDYYAHYRPGQKRHIMDGLDERVRRAARPQ
jgi:integrase